MSRNLYPPETMLGPGGVIRTPESESKQIRKILGLLLHVDYSNLDQDSINRIGKSVEMLQGLENQVSRGFHSNPPSKKFFAGDVVGQIGKDVHDVRYTHSFDGENYEHAFDDNVQVFAVMRNGRRDLLFTHKQGLPLWDEF